VEPSLLFLRSLDFLALLIAWEQEEEPTDNFSLYP